MVAEPSLYPESVFLSGKRGILYNGRMINTHIVMEGNDMIEHLQDTVTLNNGVKMSGFRLGVYKVEDGDVTVKSVKAALKNGYRSIDTASFYENEKGVGQGIKESGVPRDDIFVTSKVWNDQQGYENTLAAFEASLEKLGLDYL